METDIYLIKSHDVGYYEVLKNRCLILISMLTVGLSVNAQDTTHYVKAKIGHNVKWVSYKQSIDGVLVKSVHITQNDVRVNDYTTINDTLREYFSYRLTPHIPDSIKDSDDFDPFTVAISTGYDENLNMVTTYMSGGYTHPCQCFMAMIDLDTLPDLRCILACNYDTLKSSHWVNHYNLKGKLTAAYYEKKDELQIGEQRRYNSAGLEIENFTRCDTFLTKYDSLNREIWESYNYGCDDFRYELFYEYKDSTTYVYGVQEGKRRLSSKTVQFSNGNSTITNYFFDSSYTVTSFEGGLKVSKKDIKDDKLLESWVFKYTETKNEKQTVAYKNDKLNYRIIEREW
jgi:hypothetical protein